VLDLPVRRGVMHPPPAEPLAAPAAPAAPAQHPRDYTMVPLVPLVRPAPHRQPYRGLAALPAPALARRRRRLGWWGNDSGPASAVNLVLRAGAPAAAWVGGLGTAYLFA